VDGNDPALGLNRLFAGALHALRLSPQIPFIGCEMCASCCLSIIDWLPMISFSRKDLSFMLTRKSHWKTNLIIVGMIAPALIIALGIVIYPIINTVIKSFMHEDTGAFTLENYAYLFTNKMSRAYIWYTVWVTLTTVLLTIAISYLLAMYLRFSESRIAKFIGTLYLLPRFIPGLVAVYAVKVVIGDAGLLNRLSLLLPETSVLYNYKPGLLYNAKGVILMNLWFNIPFATMIITAALSGISTSIVESARDVGAGKIRIFFKMILPLSIGDVMIAAGSS